MGAAGEDFERFRRRGQSIENLRLTRDQWIVRRSDKQYRRVNLANRLLDVETAEADWRRNTYDARDRLASCDQDRRLGAEARTGDKNSRHARTHELVGGQQIAIGELGA